MKRFLFSLIFALLAIGRLCALDTLYLKDNLKKANKGDFIVTAQNKTYSLLHMYAKTNRTLTIEEISIPSTKVKLNNFSWRDWVRRGAPSNTSWVIYTIDLDTAEMKDFFSVTKNSWCNVSSQDNILSTLLNLRLEYVPLQQRKRVGLGNLSSKNDKRPIWQPRMVVDGQAIDGVPFDAWKTIWPKDGSELSGKTIEVFVPEVNSDYPSYFPYWLQISGLVGKAKIRIIDSGTGMVSSVARP